MVDSPGQAVGLGAVVVIVLGALVWAMKYLLTTTIPSLQAANAKALEDERQRSAASLAEQRAALLALLAEQRKACEEGQAAVAGLVRDARQKSSEEHTTLLTTARDLHTLVMDRLNVGFRELEGEIDRRSPVQPQRPRRGPPEGPRGPQDQPQPPGPQKRGPQP